MSMSATWGARSTSAVSGIDAKFVAHAAEQTGGSASITTDGVIVADGFPSRKSMEQSCARMRLKFSNLNFEISRPAVRNRKKGTP
jgi:hypothetical protein